MLTAHRVPGTVRDTGDTTMKFAGDRVHKHPGLPPEECGPRVTYTTLGERGDGSGSESLQEGFTEEEA